MKHTYTFYFLAVSWFWQRTTSACTHHLHRWAFSCLSSLSLRVGEKKIAIKWVLFSNSCTWHFTLTGPSILFHASATAKRLLCDGTSEFQRTGSCSYKRKICYVTSFGHCIFQFTFHASKQKSHDDNEDPHHSTYRWYCPHCLLVKYCVPYVRRSGAKHLPFQAGFPRRVHLTTEHCTRSLLT
jgi:hypothetical protein